MRLVTLALLLLFSLLSQSQPPSPTPGKAVKEQQSQRKQKENEATGANDTPQPSLGIGGQVITQANPNGTNQRNEKSATDWWLTRFTGALVLVAILQFWAMHKQAKFMRKGLRISIRAARSTKQAALAAKSSADAVQNIEHAWVFMEAVKFPERQTLAWRTEVTDRDMEELLQAVGVVKNYGRTPARVVYHRGEVQLGDSATTPPNPSIYERTDSVTINPFFIPPKETHGFIHMTFPTRSVLTRIEIGHLRHVPPHWFLWFCGFLDYEDVFGRTYTLRYCYLLDWVLIPNQAVFHPAGAPQYNSHTEKNT